MDHGKAKCDDQKASTRSFIALLNGLIIFKPFIVNIRCNVDLLILTILVIIYGLLQLVGIISSLHPYFPVTGSFLNPAPYSIFLASLLVICASYYFHQRAIVRKIALMLFVSGMVLLIITVSRAAWLGLIAGLLVLFIAKYRPHISKGSKVLALPLIVAALFSTYWIKKDSADGRVLIWKISILTINENMISGTGIKLHSKCQRL